MSASGRIPLRVMLITEEYPPVGSGIGVSVQRIAANLRQHGVAVTIVTYDYVPAGDSREEHTSYILEERDERGTEIFHVGPRPVDFANAGGRNMGTTYRSFGAQCLHVAERVRPDVIHSFGVWQAGYIAAVVARQLGLPHVVGVRGNDVGRDLYNPARFAAIQFVFTTAAHVAFVAHGLFRLATNVFGTQPNFSVIHNGCETPAEDRASEAAGSLLRSFPLGRPIIGMFGHVREKKGFLEVLRATQCMASDFQPNVLIVGEHSSEEWYARALSSVADEIVAAGRVVQQVGRVDRDAVSALMRACDVVVQASLDDGLPNTLLEAMALGCPLVASEIFRDDVGSDVAEYCDPYLKDSIVAALTRLLLDAGRRDVLARNARRVAREQFSPAREAGSYARLYEELLRNGNGPLR